MLICGIRRRCRRGHHWGVRAVTSLSNFLTEHRCEARKVGGVRVGYQLFPPFIRQPGEHLPKSRMVDLDRKFKRHLSCRA